MLKKSRAVTTFLGWIAIFSGFLLVDQGLRGAWSVARWNDSIGLAGLFPWPGVGQWGSVGLILGITGLWFMSTRWLLRQPEPWQRSGLWLQAAWLAGATGNLLDRWRFGAVRDVWIIPGVSLALNLADIMITLAMIGTLIWIWTWEHARHRP